MVRVGLVLRGREGQKPHQFRAELLFEPLLVSGEDGGVLQTSNCLGDQHVETVLHGEHQQRPEKTDTSYSLTLSNENKNKGYVTLG